MWISLKRQGLPEHYINLKPKEKALLYIRSIGVLLLLDYCFYRSVAALPLLAGCAVVFYLMEKKELYRRKKEELREQFREMLLLTVTGQKAGYSVENALVRGYGELAELYGEESGICRMLKELEAGIRNNCDMAKMWKTIGESTGIVEITEFASVFAIARESSGNMTVIMERTAENISNRAETQNEIETLLCARKLEQKIMNGMPFCLMLYVSVTSPGYFDGMYHSVKGMVLMSVCLLVYLLAYVIGVKISAIEV
jgi:tight adherence protein B